MLSPLNTAAERASHAHEFAVRLADLRDFAHRVANAGYSLTASFAGHSCLLRAIEAVKQSEAALREEILDAVRLAQGEAMARRDEADQRMAG